ncbi:MAG: ABC transporter permease, partial [Proteobacteria bacterium]|nr:ABC transporter permease [Pseudomonadota bacterium]
MTDISPPAPAHLSTRELVGRILRDEVRGHAGRLAIAVLCMVIVAVTTAALAWLIEPVLSQVFENKDETMLVILPLAVVAVFTLSSGANY